MADGIIDFSQILSWFHSFKPYENRVIEKPLTNCEVFFSLLKSVICVGILAMPLAYSYAGYLGGTILTILCSILMTYGIHLLIECMVESSRRNNVGYLTFPQTMEYALGEGPNWCRYCAKASNILVDVMLGFAHYGCCVVYIVFVSENIKQMFDYYVTLTDVRIVCAVVGPCLCPVFLIRHLKYLVPGNIIATIFLSGAALGIMIYVLCLGMPPLSDREMFRSPLQWPLLFGIVLFAVSSVGLVLALEENMAKPADYLGAFGVLNKATVIIVAVHVIFGFIGYWRYGQSLEGSITLNLPTNEVPAQLIKVCLIIAIYFTYALCGYVTIDIIVNHCINKNGKRPNSVCIEYVIRILFVIVSTLNAIAFPNLGPLLSLVGTLTVSILNLIFPCIIELCLYYRLTYGKFKWKLWKNIFIIIIGTVVLFYGSYLAIRDIIYEYGGKTRS